MATKLRTYIAIEIVTIVGCLSFIVAAICWVGPMVARDSIGAIEKEHSVATTSKQTTPVAFEDNKIIENTFDTPQGGLFRGVKDDLLLQPLLLGDIQRVRLNKGGSSVSLKLEFVSGKKAAFKPEQIHRHSTPRKEIASYRINNLLGVQAVPPAVGRAIPKKTLRAKLDARNPQERTRLLTETIAQKDGMVRGQLSWWIPNLGIARVGGHIVDEPIGIAIWSRYLRVGGVIPQEELHIARQISNVLIFDYLIHNRDRWSGNNARISADGKTLFFMDNTMSFSGANTKKTEAYLRKSQRFSRSLVKRLRAISMEDVRQAVGKNTEPFPFLLTEKEILQVESRRQWLLNYLDGLVAKYGVDTVLWFP